VAGDRDLQCRRQACSRKGARLFSIPSDAYAVKVLASDAPLIF
jgi:hypothetical protein